MSLFLALLVNEGHVMTKQLTKALATVSNVPYVNLSVARIDPKTLDLLPQDIAEHYMAVPLAKCKTAWLWPCLMPTMCRRLTF
jgi:hypothetical protein